MAFWLKKENKADGSKDLENLSQNEKKLKKLQSKRIDNLRIPQQLKILLKSLGSQTEFPFLTKDLSATGAFVLCSNFKRYPFQLNSTLLDATVELKDEDYPDGQMIQFIAKIARIVEAHGEGSTTISGFGIRIVQISNDSKFKLDQFIAKHGHPEAIATDAENSGAEGPQFLDQNAV